LHFELLMRFYDDYGARQKIAIEDLLKDDIFDFLLIYLHLKNIIFKKSRAGVTQEITNRLALVSILARKATVPEQGESISNFLRSRLKI
jgi:hypothetical protein